MKNIRTGLMIAAIIGLLGLAEFSQAGTKTNILQVTATVIASCNINSVTDINFGNYDPISSVPTDAAGSVILQCAKDTAYKTYIIGTRSMTGGSDTLNFDLYSDAGRTMTFPSDNSGSATNAPDINPITKIIYGRIPAQQNVGVANYTRMLTVTIEY
jgi:spore coat protein U-like protein